MKGPSRTVSHAAAFVLVAALASAAGFAGFAETVALPAWVSAPDSPIVFPGGSRIDSAAAVPAILFGFAGTASGVSVSGDAVLVETFELSPPDGALFVAPRQPLPGFDPAPAFRSIELRADTRGPFAADCHYVRTPDPFGGVFEEGGANLAWDGWLLLAYELSIGADGLLARNGWLVSGYGPENPDAAAPRGAASLFGRVETLRFDTSWNPVAGADTLRSDLYASLSGLGDVAVESMTLKREGGRLVVELESRQPAEDDWGLDEAPWSRALYGGDGLLVSSTPKGGVAAFGWEGAFQLEFEAETAGVPMTGSGLVRLPDSLGGGEFRSAPGAVRAWAGSYWEGENYFEVSAFDEPVRVSYGGWELTSADASIGRVGDMKHVWALIAPEAKVEWRGATIPFENLAFSSEGWLVETAAASGELGLPLYGGRFRSLEAFFLEDGILARGVLELPPEFGGYSIFLDRLILRPDGSFDMPDTIRAYAFDVSAGSFRLENGWLSDEGFGFGSMVFDPAWPAAEGSIRFQGGIFPNGGGLEFHGLDPFKLDGFVFTGEAAVRDGALEISGGVHYPSALPYGLWRRDPAALHIPLDGSTPSVESSFESELVVERVAGGSLRVSRGALELSGASLRVRLEGVRPAQVAPGLEGLSLDGVRVSAGGVWDFGEATLAEPVAFEREGVRYALTKLVLVDESRVLLSGRATRAGSGGTVESHGCALSAGFDGSVTIVVAEGDELRYLR
ncbi:MAG: hypothetical protein JXA15_05035 [Spirochaetales bacterium]|nr:hypothetical protein [Spirochaetales bacterium]